METPTSRKDAKIFTKNSSLPIKDLKSQLDQNKQPGNGKNNQPKTKLWPRVAKILGLKSKNYLLHTLNKAITNCREAGIITAEEQKMIHNIVNIGDIRAIDVAIPRTDIVAIKKDASMEEIRELIKTKEHTRIPVYGDNLDQIIGFIHSKDLVKFNSSKNLIIDNLIRKIIYVPSSMRVIDLLLKMRSSRIHIAIVLDEYGGTDGLVTIENIMEEIVGEIEDEHDLPDNNIYLKTSKINDSIFHIGGRVEIEKAEELIGEKIIADKEEVDFETIGGLILAVLKKVPEIGEIVDYSPALTFKVLDADMRSIRLVEVIRTASVEEKTAIN